MTKLPEVSWKPLYDGHVPKTIDPNSMLAKVANAIAETEGSYEEQARAAIEAMRVPDEAMLKAGEDAWWRAYEERDQPGEDDGPVERPCFDQVYKAMIDAALKEALSIATENGSKIIFAGDDEEEAITSKGLITDVRYQEE